MTMTAKSLFAIAGLMLINTVAIAADDPVYTGRFSNVAVGGYDTVAYFTNGQPTPGSKEFQHDYNGAVWRFSSAENKAMFVESPSRYSPQYGGYCAWAVSQGYTAKGSPKAWRIVDDKLYLNYNLDVQAKWLVDIPGFIAKADRNWPAVLDN